MAVLLFIFIGTLAGWFAAILSRTEDGPGIFKSIGLGAVAAALGGLFTNGFMLFGALDWLSVGVAALAAIVVLAVYKLVFVIRF